MTAAAWRTPPALPATGVWSHAISRLRAPEARAFAEELEELGVGVLWYPESVTGKECLSCGALLLSWTRSLVLASGIASVYARDAAAAASGARTLDDAFPGRFVLGLGISHAPHVAARGHVYGSPVATMEAYLDRMDAATSEWSQTDAAPPRLLAALNPRMIRLAAERSAGIHTYFMPPAHTARAREMLGPGPALAAEVGFVLGEDPTAVAGYVEKHLTRDNYRRALLFSGFDESDLSGSGSARLLDQVVVRGGLDDLVRRIEEHLAAGATHVCVQPLSPLPTDARLPVLREVAPALREVARAHERVEAA